jgi:hypothetical protein
LDKNSTEKLQAFLLYCSIVIRRAPRDFTEGEVKDFTQGCNIRDESPMSLTKESITKQTYSSENLPSPLFIKEG